jgi:hypothetical protein
LGWTVVGVYVLDRNGDLGAERAVMSSTLFTGIELVAATLMGGITLGVIYLTLTGWRDRRRREDEAREIRKSSRFK